MPKQKNPTECPKCGTKFGLISDEPLYTDFTGKPALYYRKAARCSRHRCDQRYWWYPKTGRITRRNTEHYSDRR